MVIKICVVGLGYVGLPLALELADHFEVIGFDLNKEKIKMLRKGTDPANEVNKETIKSSSIFFTSVSDKLKGCNFIIVCVPTPINDENNPDLSFLKDASKLIGSNLQKNSIVVFESTVYPGVTEEICVPILEKYSALKFGIGFKVGYSPERINPGDKQHTINKIIKVVSGSDEDCLDLVDGVYGKITRTYKAENIRVAEAAKVIENIQRDLNIALMNELTIIFDKLNIDTASVLKAAATKWNFHKYYPGLVGGHCIGVDPYYLTYKSKKVGYNPNVILAGRKINDEMHNFYSKKIIEKLRNKKISLAKSKILIMGLTFKPNVMDYRNSRVKNLIKELQKDKIQVYGHDPFLEKEVVLANFNVKNIDNINEKNFDLIVLAVKHDKFDNVLANLDSDKIFLLN